MSHYIPGSGFKKPLNMLENPIYPDIKKGPPRFVNSKKHWNVDVGATLMETEKNTQLFEPAVLAQSRDYNKTVYGQSSHKDVVNKAFRPPLQTYYEDFGPLTRIPTKVQAIIPHINPQTADFGHGTAGYRSKNERISDVDKAITDRISKGESRPTFYKPLEIPLNNSVLPNLQNKLPNISATSGWNLPFNPQDFKESSLYFGTNKDKTNSFKFNPKIQSGYNPKTSINDPMSQFDSLKLIDNYNKPQTSAISNNVVPINNPSILSQSDNTKYKDIRNNRPSVSVDTSHTSSNNIINNIGNFNNLNEGFSKGNISKLRTKIDVNGHSGTNTMVKIDNSNNTFNMKKLSNKLNRNGNSGFNTSAQTNTIINEISTNVDSINLKNNRPSVSANSGTNFNNKIQKSMNNEGESSVDSLIKNMKNGRPSVSANSGINFNNKIQKPMNNEGESSVDSLIKNMRNNRPSVSVHSGKNIPIYNNNNMKDEENRKRRMKTKIESLAVNIMNPGNTDYFRDDGNTYNGRKVNREVKRNTRESFSYAVTPNYGYHHKNELSHKPHFKRRLEPLKSYGSLPQTSGVIPHKGIGMNMTEYNLKKKVDRRIKYKF